MKAGSVKPKSGPVFNKHGYIKNRYDHVQSKVRKYMDYNGRAASVGRAEPRQAAVDDLTERSFLLSPG
jgi:hypothetical protein